MRTRHHIRGALVATAALLPFSISAETVPELLANVTDQPGAIFNISGVEGRYVLMQVLNEVWRVDIDGAVVERASIIIQDGYVHVGWEFGDRLSIPVSEQLDVRYLGQTAPLALQVRQMLSRQLDTAFMGLPIDAKFEPNTVITDGPGVSLGLWRLVDRNILITLEGQKTQSVPIEKLMASMALKIDL
jgi:hypothetical protein